MISLTDSSSALVMRYDLQNPKVLGSLLRITRTVECKYTVTSTANEFCISYRVACGASPRLILGVHLNLYNLGQN